MLGSGVRSVRRICGLGMALLVVLSLAGSAAAQETPSPDLAGFVRRATEGVIVPRFTALESTAGRLSDSLDAFCAAPSESGRGAVAEAFAETTIAWARVLTFPLEPLLVDNRRERFFLWPDPRGVTLRQIQPIVAGRDASVTDVTTLRGKSVAVQGLGALEYLLYGAGSEAILAGGEDGVFRCRYAVAIGDNLVEIAAAMAAELDPSGEFIGLFLNPGADNPLYPTIDSTMIDVIIGAEEGVALARDSFLVPVLGQSIDLARPRLAPLWRSGLSIRFLSTLLDAGRELLEGGDLVGLMPPNTQWIPASIANEVAAIDGLMPAPDLPIDLAGSDTGFRETLFDIGAHADNLKSLMGLSVPTALGLSGAFFAAEGL